MKRRSGFTLIELLVVVAIIALLIAILMPSLGKSRELARRSVCASNMHGMGQALSIYASQWADKLPNVPYNAAVPATQNWAGSLWMWDVSYPLRDALILKTSGVSSSAMKSRRLLYCPSNTNMNVDYMFNLTSTNNADVPELDPAYPTYRAAIGYAYFGSRPASGGGTFAPALIAAATPPLYRLSPTITFQDKMLGTVGGSNRELMVDAVIQDPAKASNYSSIVGSYSFPHTTSHMDKSVPAGGNVLYFDGHVTWTKWGDMNHFKTQGLAGGNQGPYFFVPTNP